MNDLQSILLPGIENKRPFIIAGPCSAETEEQVMETARQLAAKGVKMFRAGIWKPRTKPGGFEGVGVEGLPWLKRVKEETGMYVATEVATAKHVEEALKAGIDMLWIGARTSANPFAVQELADAVVLVWYPGEEGGTAVADILFGKISPSGKLPITFPKSLDQLPPFEDYLMKGRTYKYMNVEPMYPFGFGLSYANFTYGEAKVASTKISKKDSSNANSEKLAGE